MASSGARRTIARVGAVLGPMVVLGGAWLHLTAPAPWVLDGAARLLDDLARKGPADVVVIGPSFAATDIEPKLLGRALGDAPLRVRLLMQKATGAPVWYTILKERVYGNGLRPRLVVLVATMELLVVTALEADQLAKVAEHIPAPDDVLLAKSWRADLPFAVQRALERRSTLREPVVALFRDAPVAALFGTSEVPGTTLTEVAGKSVFADVRAGGQNRVLPGVERAEAPSGAEGGIDPERTYVPDLAQLAISHGARLVFVFPPTSDHHDDGQHLAPEVEAALITLCNRLGVGWIDARDEDYDETAYTDGRHMTTETRDGFTRLVAERILASGALSGGSIAPASVPVQVASVTRTGTPPAVAPVDMPRRSAACLSQWRIEPFAFLSRQALDRLGPHMQSPLQVFEGNAPLRQPVQPPGLRECAGAFFQTGVDLVVLRSAETGPDLSFGWNPSIPVQVEGWADQYWVYPGTTVRWEFAETVEAEEAEVSAIAMGGSGVAHLRVGEMEGALEAVADRMEGRVATGARVSFVEVDSPPDGPFLLVRRLSILSGEARSDLVREPDFEEIDLLAGRVTTLGEVPRMDVSPSLVGERMSFPAPWPNRIGCSPLQVLEDGVALPRPTRRSHDDPGPAGAGTAHVDDRVWFVASDGSDPATNGRTYVLALPEDRTCWMRPFPNAAMREWLYPGDRLEVEIPLARRRSFSGALRSIEIRSQSNVATEESLGVRILVGDEVRVDRRIAVVELEAGKRIAFEPIPRDLREPVVLQITSGSSLPPLLLSAYGSEG